MTTWRYAASSDVGLVRQANEDSLHVDERLAIVADGMGGHAAGEVASALAVKQIVQEFELDATGDGVVRAVRDANDVIIADAASNPDRSGMGTTAVVLALTDAKDGLLPVVVNVGDSRAYQLRDGALRQITSDHSVAEEWVRQGRLTPEEATVHPRRHQLTRTLGVESDIIPDVFAVAVEPGDRILLCSDGLSNELSDTEITLLASQPHTLDESVSLLVELANRNGGRDNISVVLVEFDEVSAMPASTGQVALGAASFAAAAQPNESTEPRHRRKKKSRISWRMIAFVAALGVLIGSVFVVLGWYASSNYYLANDQGQIAIYQGQPNGLLWFKPVKVIDTGFLVAQLLPADRVAIAATISEPTLAAAIHWSKYLHDHRVVAPVVTPSTTTTTASGG